MNAPIPPDAVAIPTLPIAEICRSPYNRKRFDEQKLQELAESIKVRGVIQPITVRPNPKGAPLYELVVGERRWLAAQMAGLTEIPAFWRDLDDQTAIEMQISENLQREDVHPIEEAESFELLMQARDGHTGLKADDIADRIRKSRSYVYGTLKLLALCPEVRDAFFAKKFDASIALMIARIPGKALQKKAMNEIIEPSSWPKEPMSVRRAKDYIRDQFTISLKQATFSPADAELVPSAGACSTCLKCTGNDRETFSDVEDTDVCTDTKCFDEKRLARHAQLIEQAEAKKIPVLRGEEAEKVMPHGIWSIDHDKHVPLDERCDLDPDRRTFREILGDLAPPVSTIIESRQHGQAILVELAEPKALEAALKKAGITRKGEGNAPAARVQSDEEKAEEARQEAAAERENKTREFLIEEIDLRLPSALSDPVPLIRHLAVAMILRESDWNDDFEAEGLEAAGYELPDSYDTAEELPKVIEWFLAQPALASLRYMVYSLTVEDRRPAIAWQFRESDEEGRAATPILDGFAQMVGIDHAALRAPIQPEDNPDTQQTAENADAPRPDVRYAMWNNGDWQTWTGEGKKPAWVKQWLANGKSLEDLAAALPVSVTTETAPDAGRAAQAHGIGADGPAAPAKPKSKAKAKTAPATASPSNEPAASVEASANGEATPVKPKTPDGLATQAWPFPTPSKPAA